MKHLFEAGMKLHLKTVKEKAAYQNQAKFSPLEKFH